MKHIKKKRAQERKRNGKKGPKARPGSASQVSGALHGAFPMPHATPYLKTAKTTLQRTASPTLLLGTLVAVQPVEFHCNKRQSLGCSGAAAVTPLSVQQPEGLWLRSVFAMQLERGMLASKPVQHNTVGHSVCIYQALPCASCSPLDTDFVPCWCLAHDGLQCQAA